MFRPNLLGKLRQSEGYDVYGRDHMSEPRLISFAAVNLDVGAMKTSVRADSSASRGAADQRVVERGMVLFPVNSSVNIGDTFSFQDADFKIVGKHTRFNTFGQPDHIECAIELSL